MLGHISAFVAQLNLSAFDCKYFAHNQISPSYSRDFNWVVLAACLTCVQRRLPCFDWLYCQFLRVTIVFIHCHCQVNVHIFIEMKAPKRNSGVKGCGIRGKFKMSRGELQTAKAECNGLNDADRT